MILLSGGLDSATTMAVARRDGFVLNALSFRYGQRHKVELEAANRVATAFGVSRHVVIDIDPVVLAGSSLTDDIPVPRPSTPGAEGIPTTYVPARNTIFLSYALAWAETLHAWDIFIGVNALDYSGYPDCRPEYVAAFEQMANLATKASLEGSARMRIRAPLVDMTKAEIIGLGTSLGVDYGITHSCYDPGPDGRPCSGCESCLLRARGFADAGLVDPALERFRA